MLRLLVDIKANASVARHSINAHGLRLLIGHGETKTATLLIMSVIPCKEEIVARYFRIINSLGFSLGYNDMLKEHS